MRAPKNFKARYWWSGFDNPPDMPDGGYIQWIEHRKCWIIYIPKVKGESNGRTDQRTTSTERS